MYFGLAILPLSLCLPLVSSCPTAPQVTEFLTPGPEAFGNALQGKVAVTQFRTWPGGNIPYCFEDDGPYKINEKFQGHFERGLELWTKHKTLELKFERKSCPKIQEESNRMLRVRLDQNAKYPTTISGFRGSKMRAENTDDPAQHLTIATKYDFGKSNPSDQDWAGLIAHQLSHVIWMMHQSQSPYAHEKMDLNSKALSAYPSGFWGKKQKQKDFEDACADISAAHSDPKHPGARSHQDPLSWEPALYAPWQTIARMHNYLFPKQVNWGSITFYNRAVDAKKDEKDKTKKQAVLTKKNGEAVPYPSWNKGPNEDDSKLVNNLYKMASDLNVEC